MDAIAHPKFIFDRLLMRPKFVCLLSQNRSKLVLKLSQNRPKLGRIDDAATTSLRRLRYVQNLQQAMLLVGQEIALSLDFCSTAT